MMTTPVTDAVLNVLAVDGDGLTPIEVWRAMMPQPLIYTVHYALFELVVYDKARAEGKVGSLRYWRSA